MEDKKLSLSPYDGFQTYAEADIYGSFVSGGRPLTKEEQEKLNAEIAQRTQEIAQRTQEVVYRTQLHTQQIQQQVNNQINQLMYNLNNNLQNTFANIFG